MIAQLANNETPFAIFIGCFVLVATIAVIRDRMPSRSYRRGYQKGTADTHARRGMWGDQYPRDDENPQRS